jgi:IS30 family transposase
MDPNISKLLDEIPEKPPRSKLELHADVITALRQKRRTYREIAEFFREHLAITVAPSTIHDFVRVRRRRGKRNVASSSEPNRASSPRLATVSPIEDDRQRKIAALTRQPSVKEPQPLFTYEEDKPLKLRRKPPADKID